METEPSRETPHNLDVINIDGRLAQMANFRLVKWVDTGEGEEFHYPDYDIKALAREEKMVTMDDYFAQYPEEKHLLKNIHWGPEQDTQPFLRGHVTFFGWLTLRKENSDS